MSIATERDAITARWNTELPFAADKTAWDALGGPQFDPPTYDGTTAGIAAALWARPSIHGVPLSGQPLGLGSGAKQVRRGLLIVQCFGPARTGEKELVQKVDTVRATFHRVNASPVQFEDADAPVKVVNQDAPYDQFNVTIPYWVQDTV